MTQSENNRSTGFRPIRRGQVIEGLEEDQSRSQAPETTFTRRTTEQTSQRSVFPEWDLLPPKSIIRRKGQ